MTASEQARADAIADAETLQDFALSDLDPNDWRGKAITRAGQYMDASDHAFWASRAAIRKARAAFRAVPGLRGA